ncbi:MAG TPA: exodeoxyribonuclease VII large subunit [Acidimicrobiales bacterium]|nr:exodeoxyribonuclease VII large subunit [Acidimicrobiales bacterium]
MSKEPSFSTPSLWDDGTEPTWSVSEIGEAITLALRKAFPDEIWLRGEIRNLKRGNTGMVWFDLVEPAPGGQLGRPAVATLPIVLFDAARRRVNASLTRAGGAVRMENGTEVRIKGRVGYWAPGGRLQVQMLDIDPAFTLGRLAADRERLLRQLEAEGLLGRQAQLPFPLVPLRLGLVTSVGSAADHDVLDELHRSGIGFQVKQVDTRVQGRSAPRSVAWGLRAAASQGVDLVMLVRGGGSATDLAAFDSELIARAIAELPVPVVTGIGHDVDRTVADDVAHTCYKTPTACAQAIVGAVRAFDAELAYSWHAVASSAQRRLAGEAVRLRTCARHVALGTRHGLAAADAVLTGAGARLSRSSDAALSRAGRSLERATGRVEAGARVHLRSHDRRVEALAPRLSQRAPLLLDAAARRLDGVDAQVRALDPVRTLARGWSITRAADGSVVRSPADVAPGAELTTTLAAGRLTSTVTATSSEDDG